MKQSTLELSVIVPSKAGFVKIPEYGHQGSVFVEGRQDQRFGLRLRNDRADRVLAVISIDGVSVLDGTPCTPQSNGYVLPAFSSYDLLGWRSGLEKIHRFFFKNKQHRPYAKSATGGVTNCGVISVKFFSEKIAYAEDRLINAPIVEEHHHHHHHHYPVKLPVWPNEPIITWGSGQTICATNSCSTAGLADTQAVFSACAAAPPSNVSAAAPAAKTPAFTLGTGWGETEQSVVTQVSFERGNEISTLTLYYSDKASLKEAGIDLSKATRVTTSTPALPQAFTGFCRPPVNS